MNEGLPDSPATEGPPASPRAELALAHLDTLPTLAPIAVKLLQLCADSRTDTSDVAAVLRSDPSLTTRLVSVANSAAWGAKGSVATLDQAIVRLRLKAVRNVVLTTSVFEIFASPAGNGRNPRFDCSGFWDHALAVACAARRLAVTHSSVGVDPDEAFIAGLLHDIGKVALHAVYPKAYERAAAHAAHARGDIADAEREILGADHTVAGRHLCERWGLPRFICDVVWLHHVSVGALTETTAPPALIAIVQLADALVREQRIGESGNYAVYETAAQLAHALGIAGDDLAEVVHELAGEVAEFAPLLGLRQQTTEAIHLKSLTRANSELGKLNVDLMGSNRRLSAAARYFSAITWFDQQLEAQSELGTVVAALAEAARGALAREWVAAFGIRDQRSTVELAFVGDDGTAPGTLAHRVSDELADWLRAPGDVRGLLVARAPRTVRNLVSLADSIPDGGDCWLLPILHKGELAGGITYFSDRNERDALSAESDELRSFLASLGMAIGRANAQQSARRLADELAESNRRLQQIQSEVLRTRTLSMIAEMASGAGHELNSPLTVISGRAQMLQNSASDEAVRRVLGLIHEKAHECSRIVTELMDFARPAPPTLAEIELPPILKALLGDWLDRGVVSASQLRLDYTGAGRPDPGLRVVADRDQLRTVLDEIVENAVAAVAPEFGSIVIGWSEREEDYGLSRPASTRPGIEPKDGPQRWVEITVRDNGVGMPPAVVQRVFDPFYSRREAGRGRGLGLARAHRIVDAHGGRIWVESQPKRGSTFHVIIPQARGRSPGE